MSKNRHLHHIKAFRTTTGVGHPKKSEGVDGDITIRALKNGLFLFVKYQGFWYHVSKLQVHDPVTSHKHKHKPISTFPGTVQGSGPGGGSGDIGILPGSKFILSGKNSKRGIAGDSYIQSGTTNTSSSLGSYFGRDFMNITVGGRPMMLVDENGSDSRVLFGTDSLPASPECKVIYLSANPGASAFGAGKRTRIVAASDTAISLIAGDADNTTTLQIVENGGGANDYIAMQAEAKFYLDGAGNTYIQESSADHISMVAGGVTTFVLDNTSAIFGANQYMTLTDNEIDVSSGDLTLDVAGDIIADVGGGQFTITDTTLSDPDLVIQSNSNDSLSGSLIFDKQGRTGASDDYVGMINFNGADAGNNTHNYAFIFAKIDVSTEGEESGKLELGVASHDGSVGADVGLRLVGGSEDAEVDVSIGKGTSSLTSVAGNLDMGASFTIKESASALADVASKGQIWVKNDTPNELAFTDDAGTDIVGIGKYHYETKVCNFYSTASTGVYLPIAGYIIDRDTTANYNEYVAMIAPFNGTLEKFAFRSEASQGTGSGAMSFRVLESADGTETPGTTLFRKDLSSLSIADDTYTEYDLTSPTTGSFPVPITKGRIYAFYFDPHNAPYDTNTILVFKWDVTS
jgi:hypothetical protein